MRVSRHLLIGVLLCAARAWAQDEVASKLEASQAADVAADLEEQAFAVELDVQTEAGETMQAYVDQIATIATLLESQMRAGMEKGDTQQLYRELRRIRLDVLELLKSGKVELPPGSAEVFEGLMSELGSYYSETPAAVSAEAASPSQ